jgi:hypothetical protein
MKKKSRRSIKSKGRNKIRKSKSKCKKYLKDKIAINMGEYKSGLYSSRAQAIAVSYSQILKKHPHCKRSLRRKRSNKK